MGDSEIGKSGSSLGTCFKQEEKSTAGWEEATCRGRLEKRSSLGSIVGKSQAGWRVSRVTARLIGERVEVEVGEGINEAR
jgi:hypothetical protein